MKMYVSIPVLLIVFSVQIPLQSQAQNKHLTPVVMTSKVAFFDPARLRTEYRAYSAAKDSIHKAVIAGREFFEKNKRQLDEQTKKQLFKDSVEGGKQKRLILDNENSNHIMLEAKYVAEIKQHTTERVVVMRSYEDRINNAIRITMAEGAYTQLKTLKDSAGVKGTDITNTILQKLNH